MASEQGNMATHEHMQMDARVDVVDWYLRVAAEIYAEMRRQPTGSRFELATRKSSTQPIIAAALALNDVLLGKSVLFPKGASATHIAAYFRAGGKSNRAGNCVIQMREKLKDWQSPVTVPPPPKLPPAPAASHKHGKQSGLQLNDQVFTSFATFHPSSDVFDELSKFEEIDNWAEGNWMEASIAQQDAVGNDSTIDGDIDEMATDAFIAAIEEYSSEINDELRLGSQVSSLLLALRLPAAVVTELIGLLTDERPKDNGATRVYFDKNLVQIMQVVPSAGMEGKLLCHKECGDETLVKMEGFGESVP